MPCRHLPWMFTKHQKVSFPTTEFPVLSPSLLLPKSSLVHEIPPGYGPGFTPEKYLLSNLAVNVQQVLSVPPSKDSQDQPPEHLKNSFICTGVLLTCMSVDHLQA